MAETTTELCHAPWLLAPALAHRVAATLAQAERETGISWRILSGYRSPADQDDLRRKGRPTAPNDCSTHLTCPSTGADVKFGSFPTRAVKATFGRIATENGLRWGGGSPPDDAGIPSDWNHVDLGPRC